MPYSQAGNTCVTFNGFTGTGNVTSSGTVSATGGAAPSAIGISVVNSSTITGNITNSGRITANGAGIAVGGGSTVTGSLTNATGAMITTGGIGISVASGTVGSIINNGTITGLAIYPTVGIDVSNSTVNGNIINNGAISSDSTGAIQLVNGGTVKGSVENYGSITATDTNPGVPPGTPNLGAGIYVFGPSAGSTGETITGSIINEVGGTISGGYGIAIFGTSNTLPVVVEGSVSNAGTIGTSKNPVAVSGIVIGGATIDGAVSNSGSITAARNGILLVNLHTLTASTGGTYTFSGGQVTVKGGVTNSGSITSTGTGYAGIALDGASVSGGITNTATGSISATNGVGILVGNTGKMIFAAGSVWTINGGPSSVSGGITNEGTITAKTGIEVTGGSSVTGGVTNSGTITTTGGASILVTGAGTSVDSITNAAGGKMTGGGIFVGPETTSGAITNNGTITVATYPGAAIDVSGATVNGNITNTGNASANSTGVIQIINTGKVNGSVENSGTLTNTYNAGKPGFGNLGAGIYVYADSTGPFPGETITGSIENLAGGKISGGYGIQIFATASTAPVTVQGNVSNAGTITAARTGIQIGSATVSGALINSGTITAVQNGIQLINLTVASGVPVTLGNAGPPSVAGGITNSGSITSTGTGYAGIDLANANVANGITNTATGSISATNGVGILLSNTGKIIFTPGTTYTSGTGPSKVTGGITNEGTITAKTGIEVTGGSSVTGGVTNSGTITTTGGASILVTGAGTSVDSITNTASGKMTGGGIFVGPGAISGTITNNGKIVVNAYPGPAIAVSEATVNGNVVNTGTIKSDATGAIEIENGGTLNGSVENFGSITANDTNPSIPHGTPDIGIGIWVFAPASSPTGQIITGSVINEAGGTISGGFGIGVFGTNNNVPVIVKGNVVNAGTIGTIANPVAYTGIVIGSATIDGAVSNSGSIVAAGNGISLVYLNKLTYVSPNPLYVGSTYTYPNNGPAVIKGGVTNSGSITSTGTGYAGIALDGASVSGGITNALGGTITAANGAGILLTNTGEKMIFAAGSVWTITGGPSSVTGGITNQGTITAKTGIMVTGGSTVSGGITNSGNITGSRAAIDVTGEGAATVINQEGGTIAGNILLSTFADTVNVSGGTINGNIVGAGSSNTINFELGPGTFTYAAAYGFTGINQVNIDSGTVILNGTNNATYVDVYGGALAGTGTIDPLTLTIHSGGTFAPGAPGQPGTSMTITGNLAFLSGALYVVQVNSTSATFANVSGTTTLAGDVLAVFAPGTDAVMHQYDILDSGQLSGRFAKLDTANLPAGFDASLLYTPTDVVLNLDAVLGVGTALNSNQRNVVNTIDNFFNGGGALTPSFFNLFGLSGGNLANALSRLDGEVATDAERGAFQIMTEFMGVMLDPFVYGRLAVGVGVGGDSVGGPGIGHGPDEQANLPPDVAVAYTSVLKTPPAPAPFAQRWTAWGASYGASNTAIGDPAVGSSNVSAQTYGVAGGMDYHFSPDTIFGFALAGGGTGWGLASGLGSGRSDAVQAGVYGITRAGPAYLAAALAFTNHWMTTNRSGLGDQLTADFDAQSFGGRIEAGYRYSVLPTFGITPYAAVQAQDFHTPSYNESDPSGGGGFGLSYNAMNAADTRTELGARFDDPTLVGGMPLIPFGRVAWAHDFVSNPALSAVFESLPGASFTVNGAPMPQNSALTSAGAQLFLTPQLSLIARFDGEFASGSQTYAGSGTLRYTW